MILVTGATGGVGRYLVDELLAAGQDVRAVTRNPETARLPAAAEVVSTVDMPLDGVTAVFLNPILFSGRGPNFGGGDPSELLGRFKEHGVRRIVLLSAVATLEGEKNPIGAHHLRVERPIEAEVPEWTFLRPGAFDSNVLRWADQIRKDGVVRSANGQAQTAPIHEADIAAVAARALLHDDLLGAKPVLTGPESLTAADQVRIVGEAIGKPVRFEELSHEEALAEMMQGGRMTEEAANSLLKMFASFVGRRSEVSPEVERITGRPARTFHDWAVEHAGAFL